MKFLEQVKSYQRALTRKSRLFSLLMMASGIGLVAAAPFLSYEVSKIECYEKGTMSSNIGDDEVVILKNDWERKESEIDDLKKKIENKDDRITKLIDEANCDDVVEVIQNEKKELQEANKKLEEEKEEIEREKNDCRKQLAACEKEKENNNKSNDCEDLEKEIGKLNSDVESWKNQYNECIEMNLNSNAGNEDCSTIEQKLVKCNSQWAKSNKTIAELRERLILCSSDSKLSISGTFNHKETFTLNENSFVVSMNRDDVGVRYRLLHNGRDVTKQIRALKAGSTYTYNEGNKKNRITFGKIKANGVRFKLSSIN